MREEVDWIMASADQERMARAILLRYFNRYLRDRGVISEREYLRLVYLIETKYLEPK